MYIYVIERKKKNRNFMKDIENPFQKNMHPTENERINLIKSHSLS